MAKRPKTATKSARPPTIPQPNGKGALYAGGVPGNAGGSGRPPSALRARMRGSLDERLHVAESIIDDKDADASDKLRALDLLAKYGLGTTTTATDTEGRDIPAGKLTPEQRRAEVIKILTESKN